MTIKYGPILTAHGIISTVEGTDDNKNGEISIMGSSIVVKCKDGDYAPLAINESGALYVDVTYNAKELKKKQMLEAPKEFPLAAAIYG